MLDAARVLHWTERPMFLDEGEIETVRDAMIRRLVSTAYYAVFAAVCTEIARALVGDEPDSIGPEDLWVRAYRTLDHARLRQACTRIKSDPALPRRVKELATSVINLQTLRLEADYIPARLHSAEDGATALDIAVWANSDLEDLAPAQRKIFIAELLVRPKDR